MSIATTLSQIKARLAAITSPQALAKIYDNPRDAADVGSFPVAVLSLDPEAQHTWSMAASGLARHGYVVGLWLFVGAAGQAPLHELHARCLVWPEPIAEALYSGLTLSDTVEWMGDGESGALYTYTIGVEEWAGKNLFRLKISLPITEKIPMPMDA